MTRWFYGRSPAEQYMSSRPVAQTRVVHPRGVRVNSRRCAALEGKRHELSGASSGPFAQSMAPRSRSAKRDTNAESTTPRAVCAPVSSRRSCVAVVGCCFINSLSLVLGVRDLDYTDYRCWSRSPTIWTIPATRLSMPAALGQDQCLAPGKFLDDG